MTTEAQVKAVDVERLWVPVVGQTPLLVHKFAEKAKRQMLATQQGAHSQRERRDPSAEVESALYRIKDGGYGFPATAFKAATVGAARFYGKAVTMTGLRQSLFFGGEPGDDGQAMVRLFGDYRAREDMVRVGQGTDIRFRPEFPEWHAVLDVTYVKNLLDRDSVLSLIDAGGRFVGIGDWRPEKSGTFGTYAIDYERGIEVAE